MAPRPWNLGPAPADFSALGNLGNSFFGAYDKAQKQQTLADLGKDFAAGNYAGAAGKAAALGDLSASAQLAGLQQKNADRALASQAVASWGADGMSAPSAAVGPSVAPASLVQNESGGNWQAQNNAVGAGGQRGHFGRLQFGQARLQEAAAAGAIPQGITPQAFMASPEMQRRAETWHFNDIDNHIRQSGLDRAVGQTVNGVPITLDGMRAVAHLGGKTGLSKFVASGGRYNPADENGTRLSDYLARHGGAGTRPVQVAETEADVQRLEAQQAAQQPPIQVAQAPGGPQADLPAQGAAPAQGFAIPGGGDVDQSIANDPNVKLWMGRLNSPASLANDGVRAIAQRNLDLAVKDAERKLGQTEAVKNYRFYVEDERRNGRQPMGFQDFRKSTVPQTNVNLPVQEKEYDKQAAKDYAEMNRDLIKGGQAANMKIATLNRLESLLSNPNIRTGAGAQLALQAARLGKSVFGIETEGLGPAEAVNAIANQFALELRNPSGGAGMPGALSDKDREFLMQSTPGLERDPEGNRLLIDYMRRINQRSVDVERLRRDYVKANKGRIDEGFFDKLAEFSEKNPLFPEAPPAQRGPVTVRSAADYDKLKSGDQFMDSDGNLRTKR